MGARAGFLSPIPGGLIAGGVAGYIVGNNLGASMSVNYNANEYIYFDDGTCLECDTYQFGEEYECPDGTIVSNGSNVLSCHTTATGDYWQEKTLYPCPNSPIQSVAATGTKVQIKASIEKPVRTGVNVYSGDACFYIECANGGTYDQTQNACITKNTTTPPKNDNPGGGSSLQNCLNSRNTEEGKACCYVPASVAAWKDGQCVCADAGKKFDVPSKSCRATQGASENPSAPIATIFDCGDATLMQLNEWLIKYNGNMEIKNAIEQILNFCTNDDNRQQIEFNRMMTELRALIAKADALTATQLAEQAATAELKLSNARRKAESAAKKINAMKDGFEKTVWKTSEGNFNGSRLLSDSVAGVVLGTAGGLITSNVIKKNQVENGFEDIQCTVGGQVVAGWGDQFRVGIH